MRIIAIDPGYERLGIAIIEKNENSKESLIYSECFQTHKDLPHSERLRLVGDKISQAITEYRPDGLAIETLYFSTNKKTALLVAETRGIILSEAAKASIPIYEYTPPQIKVAVTGYGKSDKKAVINMIELLLPITKNIKFDDEYDAIAVGLTCLASVRSYQF